MQINSVELQVCVAGKPVREYGLEGRTIIEGRPDSAFSVKVKNSHGVRALAVVLVDGINVISGQVNDLERGYVIPAYGQYDITGWRQSDSKVAEFVFKTKKKSYAANQGDTSRCGVISLVARAEKITPPPPAPTVIERHIHHDHYWPTYIPIWRDRPYPRYYPEFWCSTGGGSFGGTAGSMGHASFGSAVVDNSVQMTSFSANSSVMNAASAGPEFTLGAAWGSDLDSVVSETQFEIGAELAAIEIYYNDRASLKKMGVDLTKTAGVAWPSALPTKYCQPPTILVKKAPVADLKR